MDYSLHRLFQAIATAPTEQTLRFRFMDSISEYFGVQRWGIYLLDTEDSLASVDVKGVPDAFIERYQQVGKSVDLVLWYVMRYHAPAHEELVLPKGTWKQSQLYKRCCAAYDHEHIMTGPIIGQGQLIGTVNFARTSNTPAFSQLDLASLGAVCTHFSARLAELRHQLSVVPNPLFKRLTPREVQIANLVAKGLTNAEIGAELWITQNSVKQALKRMFRKLEVSARTEMVARLRDMLPP
ncbi:LuxR C-terminal-related transcriptional regulator [Gloeocapsopsis dulcis]|uniref:Transcriptional regulator n=1 Tax=Gloeocapsopsis dulcis AAB1 = 1H9 TaxID=1433147 RepID=A0A6N8FTY1_9CHRO|nr:LuxR C-terminal-related transcriptional regulator [Gloeocapsopsis dulcis]MUL36580.1 transcriptional regulator [Gloeocapsopsis dulcis AAB1 = 1H9]WNN87205.1 LuxR C-terminal-related transcriptional regulator [Gloeocapsopsis dulcis]